MSLSKLIQKQVEPFPHHVAVDIMAQIARGVCYLHGMRVAHRDLKPDNVVLSKLTSSHGVDNFDVKLVDLGISKLQIEPSKVTTTVNGVGTYRYKAPEVRFLAPTRNVYGRSWRVMWLKADVWSFAITCVEILTLKDYIEDENGDVESIL